MDVELTNYLEKKLALVEWGRMHYSSSPDRGLDNILYLLPWIVEKCPDVKLHIYYSFHNWEAAARSRNNSAELKQIEDLQRTIGSLSNVVVNHGRVDQKTLFGEWWKSWCWCYMTTFTETSCLTAAEAQLTGTPIVCSNVAALQTTVGAFGLRIEEHPYSKEGREKALAEVIRLYQDRDHWVKRMIKSLEGGYTRRLNWQQRFEDYWLPLAEGRPISQLCI